MNKFVYFLIFLIFLTECSFNKNSKFWTSSEIISKENEKNYEEIFVDDEALTKEFNPNLKLKLTKQTNNSLQIRNYLNNDGRFNYDGNLDTSSRYKFSKIKKFYQFEPVISFNKDNIIFFDNKGSILQFNDQSNLIWKKNFYNKSEKKLRPILQFANNNNFLVVADNIAKYYMLDINNGNLIWSKSSEAPFNSQLKIYKDKIFVIDSTNTLRCFSIKDGNEIWKIRAESSLIRSQKKLSIVIVDEIIYFNSTTGDISAVNYNNGELLWQLPTQSSLTYEASFSLETSDLVTDTNSIFFSNNKNQFFSIDIGTGSFNWENKINSNLRPTLIDNFLFTVSIEGYLVVIDKNNGNILRVTDIFNNFKPNKRKKIKPTGFVAGLNKIYVSTNNGRLLIIDIASGKAISTLKIDNEKISRPFVFNKNLFVIKDNAIIKLN